MKGRFRVFFMVVFVAIFLNPDNCWSWWTKSKNLSRQQQKSMAEILVHKVMQNSFFADEELSRKLVLSKIHLEGEGLNTTTTEFTDLLLNVFLSHPKVIVVNQDLKMDLSLDYQLTFYLPEYEARKKGLLLGAGCVVTGRLSSKVFVNEKGKPKTSYTALLEIKDIHTNSIMVTESYTVEKSKKKKI